MNQTNYYTQRNQYVPLRINALLLKSDRESASFPPVTSHYQFISQNKTSRLRTQNSAQELILSERDERLH